MRRLSRRTLIAAALSHGAVPAFACAQPRAGGRWTEARERYPQGVASGDPGSDSVLIWTRRSPDSGTASVRLVAELAEDERFERVVSRRIVAVSPEADWTCRVLVGGLKPSTLYWYRFTDAQGAGSRVGRTQTAPSPDDDRPVRFAFVSCQNVNLGPLTAWRRMVYDANRRDDSPEFVLHLGDFVYDDVWRSADHPQGYLDRRIRDIAYPHGEKQGEVVVAASLEDYRTLYRTYLADPDLQCARALWPFVAIWDNGEYSDKGWQGLQRFGDVTRPAQSRKVAANQAWFEYTPSRAVTLDGSLERFRAPKVVDAEITRFDPDGLGMEPNNLAAVGSLRGYRTLRWGRHVELILTDQRSYRSEDYTAHPDAKLMSSTVFPQMVPFESLQAIDAGRTWAGGRPPQTLRFAEHEAPNFRREAAPRTLLGAEQKAWLLERLSKATATWKVWADTVATLDMRADPQHLPTGLTEPWPGAGYAGYARTDHSTAYAERGEILDLVAERRIAGFVTLSGDRHSFWAGLAAKALPPEAFQPVGLSFVVGSISSPGMVEGFEHTLPKAHPLRSLYLIDRPGAAKPEPSVNLLLKHGVRTCLDYAAHGDLVRAKALSDPGLAPHVRFVDMGGHGYALVTAAADRFSADFVCIPRPVADTDAPDGGPLRYRVRHAAELWRPGEAPRLSSTVLEGDAGLSA